MSDFTRFAPTALWCILQVTLLATFVAGWCVLLRRSGPAIRSLAMFTGLVLIVALTALSFSPWPAWSIPTLNSVADRNSPTTSKPRAAIDAENAGETIFDDARSAASPQPDSFSPASAFWRSFVRELQTPTAPVQESGWRWPSILAAVLGAGVMIGVVRLVIGLALVRTYRTRSRPVADAALFELRDVLQAELGCCRRIALYESNLLTTAATVGWRSPLIILPAGWRRWTDDERRAVLAHEIAHIARDDFPTWVAAQVALVLHFYHPLVHWLCARLRLEQELAADAAAARLAGGQQTYLTILAAMALRQPDRPLAWPARTFLPTRGTFMRRIEMLRDGKLGSTKSSAGMKAGTVVVLAAAGLLIAGLRGAAAPPDTAAVSTAIAATVLQAEGATATTGLEFVPRDAVVVATIRPARLLARPELAAITKALEQQGGLKDQLGISADRIEQLTIVVVTAEVQPGKPAPQVAGIIVKGVRAGDAGEFLRGAMAPTIEPAEYGGRKYLKSAGGAQSCGFLADEKTAVFAETEAGLRRMIVAGTTGASQAKWTAGWSAVSIDEAAMAVNCEGLRPMLDSFLQPGQPANPFGPMAPLWQNANSMTTSFKFDKKVVVRGRLTTDSMENSKRVKETLAAVVTLGRNMLSAAKGNLAQVSGDEGAILLGAAEMADALLDSAEVVQKERDVEFTISLSGDQANAVASLLLPATTAARGSAREAQSMNNLRQIALAMHNYHEAFGSFPPAAVFGPDGKTTHSWRVALLPFLEQAALYNEYDLGQPWDSETNKKVLAKMPDVYRDPNDPPTSTNASYFAFTGPETVFSNGVADKNPAEPAAAIGRAAGVAPGAPAGAAGAGAKGVKGGVKIAEILDGTSNTFLVVEAKRETPWTKPEDIPYAADKPFPKLGGRYPNGFLAAFCDGAVHLIPATNDEKTLRQFVTKAAGEPSNKDKLFRNGPQR